MRPSRSAATTASRARGFVDLAQDSGANLVVFTLFASTGFLLIVVVALFAGDTVPCGGELVEPALPAGRARTPRSGCCARSWSSPPCSALVALVFLPAWTLLVGGIAYGWGPYVGPTGDQLGWPQLLGRLAVIVGLPVRRADRGRRVRLPARGARPTRRWPPSAAAVLLMIVCAILDTITALGGLRQGLPGHYAFAWADALAPTVDWSAMVTGALWSIGYAIVLIGVAVWHFLRKDITS